MAGKPGGKGRPSTGKATAANNPAGARQVKKLLDKATQERRAAIGDPAGWDASSTEEEKPGD